MKKEDIKFLCQVFNIRRNPDLRTLIEVLVPKAGEVLSLPKNFNYRDLYFALYENTLERRGKNRVKVYDINSVGEVLSLPKNFNYRDLYFALYENTLERRGKNRVKVYDINSVINETYCENLIDYREFRREEARLPIKQKKEYKKSLLVDCFVSSFK